MTMRELRIWLGSREGAALQERITQAVHEACALMPSAEMANPAHRWAVGLVAVELAALTHGALPAIEASRARASGCWWRP